MVYTAFSHFSNLCHFRFALPAKQSKKENQFRIEKKVVHKSIEKKVIIETQRAK